jgi:alkaline phosphatase
MRSLFAIVPGALLALAASSACAVDPSRDAAPALDPAAPVKHIVLFIGDGMHLAHEVAVSRYLYGKRFGLRHDQFPYRGVVATWDVTTYNAFAEQGLQPPYDPAAIIPTLGYDPEKGGTRPVYKTPDTEKDAYFLWIPPGWSKPAATDSASAATAWATGYKTDDGNVAWLPGDPPDGQLPTIAELLRQHKNFSIGVVSTVPFTHATPAAHVSHNTSRNNYVAIGNEILFTTQPDVVIGGGWPLANGPANPNYQYIGECAYNAAFVPGPKTTACQALPGYDELHQVYVTVERAEGVDGSVSLLTAAQDAIQQGKKLFGLFGGSNGNFESPLPHNLPGTPLIERGHEGNPTLATASLAALKVLSQNPHGFFVMIEQGDIDWANHANDYQRMIGTGGDLEDAVSAVLDFINQPGDDLNLDNTLVIVTADHANSYMRFNQLMAAGVLPEQIGVGQCGYGGPPCSYPNQEISYGTTNHTNEPVMLYAVGHGHRLFSQWEGAWYEGTRIIDNTQIFHAMMAAAGIPTAPTVVPAE